MNDCADILKKGFYDEFEATEEREIQSQIAKSLRLSREELEHIVTTRDTSFGISIPFAEALLSAEFEDSRTAELLRNLRIEYGENISEAISESHVTWILSRTINRDVVRAWQTCVERNVDRGLSLTIEGDPYSEFNLHVNWIPRNEGEAGLGAVRIRQVSVVGAVPIGYEELAPDMVVERYTGLVSDFKRIGSGEGNITIIVEGMEPASISLPAINARKISQLRVVPIGKKRQTVKKVVNEVRTKESVYRQGRKHVNDVWKPPRGWQIESFTHRMSRALGKNKDDCPGGVEAYREGDGIRMKFYVYHGPFIDRYRCRCSMHLNIILSRQELVQTEGKEQIFNPHVKLNADESADFFDLSSIDDSEFEETISYRVSVDVEDVDGFVVTGTGAIDAGPGREMIFVNGIEIRRAGNRLVASNVGS